VKVRKPDPAEIERLRAGQVLIRFLDPLADAAGVEALEGHGVIAFALESIPRSGCRDVRGWAIGIAMLLDGQNVKAL
jgi:NAD/NADP transhydrogenase alpha subunit